MIPQVVTTGQRPLPVTIGVDDLVDMRPQRHGSDNKKWMGFIPGVLWLDIGSDVPEIYTAFSPFDSRPLSFNVARSLAADLHTTELFKKVVFLPEDPYTEVDYRMEGILRRSHVRVRGYYYGSSIYTWLTRVLGLPYVSYKVALKIDFRLRSMATKQVVWRGSIEGEREDKYYNVYSLARGREGKHIIAYNFTKIIAEAFPRVLQGVRGAIEGNGR